MRNQLTLLFALTALSTPHATGCGPTLNGKVRSRRYFVSKRRCSQGPLDIHLAAAGARWGERVSVTAYAPRKITGRYVYSINGKVGRTGWFGYFEKPDNARCVASKTELGARVKAGEPGSKSGSGKEASPGKTSDPADTKAPTGATADDGLMEVSKEYVRRNGMLGGYGTTRVQSFGWSVGMERAVSYKKCGSDKLWPNPLSRGAKIRIRIWSAKPNDLDGVVFKVTHTVFKPSVSRDKWMKHVRRRIAACKRKERRRKEFARRRARSKICTWEYMGHHWTKVGVVKGVHQYRAGLSYALPYKLKKPCRCKKTPNDVACWGPGGMKVYEKRFKGECLKKLKDDTVVRYSLNLPYIEFNRKTRFFCIRHLNDAKCWGPGGYRAFNEREARRIEAKRRRERLKAEARRRKEGGSEPTGPPPPAKRETRPPRSSRNAMWVPGYWFWSKRSWHWIRGWWRTPKSDVLAGLTVRARRAPPRSRSETRPPRPSSTAVWTPGFWQWGGRSWVWVRGAWRIPPSGRHRWRGARWRRGRTGVVFLPGGWVLDLR